MSVQNGQPLNIDVGIGYVIPIDDVGIITMIQTYGPELEQTIDQKFNQREKDQSGARRALIARQGRSETGAQTLAAIRSADRKLLAGQSTEAKASRKRARDALLGQGRSVNLFADELGVA